MEPRPADLKRTTLIAGCGYAGTRLAMRLMDAGPVLALVRSAASVEALAGLGIPAMAANFDGDPSTPFLNLPETLGAVVYLAPPSGQGHEDLRVARFLEVLGTRHLESLLYISTTGVYGDTGGAPVDEASPTMPREDRSRQRLDAEHRVARWCADHQVRCVVFRVPAIYGPYRLPLERLQRGEPVLRDEDSGPGNRIHVDDLVGACMAALRGTASGVFNLTDGAPGSMATFTSRVAALAGLPAPCQITWAEAQTSLSPGLLSFLRESRLVTSGRHQELGWTPRYGHPDDGIRASLKEMGL
jgi:nucleoside-diphosphate-sugar epimerase